MNQVLSELYTTLYPKAFDIISGVVRGQGITIAEWKEIAHDITVDFLFFSTSFKQTYDRSRSIKPFFASYVRLKCRRVLCNRLVKMKKEVPSELLYALSANDVDVVSVVESKNWMLSHLDYLKGKYFIPLKGTSISLRNVYLVNLRSNLELGKTSTKYIAERLGCSVYVATAAIAKMRRLLRKRYIHETSNSDRD